MTALYRILQLIGLAALAGSIVPACLFMAGRMDLDAMKTAMLVATIVWFIAIPLADRLAPEKPGSHTSP